MKTGGSHSWEESQSQIYFWTQLWFPLAEDSRARAPEFPETGGPVIPFHLPSDER